MINIIMEDQNTSERRQSVKCYQLIKIQYNSSDGVHFIVFHIFYTDKNHRNITFLTVLVLSTWRLNDTRHAR